MRDLTDGLQSAVCAADGVHYALLGHSMGAWLAYELALEMRRRGMPAPLKVFVSSNRAPSLAGPQHDPDPLGASISTLPPSEFWPRFEGRYGANPDLKSPGVRAFLLPLLRADFACIEHYRGPADEAPLSCPLAAIGARGDNRFMPEQLGAWRACTTGDFKVHWFDAVPVHSWATPHRFLIDDPAAFQAWIGDDLLQLLPQKNVA